MNKLTYPLLGIIVYLIEEFIKFLLNPSSVLTLPLWPTPEGPFFCHLVLQ